ncbi:MULTISPECIES: ATP-grasp domain-containing protein [unclassified Caballeronia]|uniref:D-alanine--D-alanine ligase family protein n=1 Tax=unclassified Caballeronia TaxID=2646786 RepID=UPI002855489E|nr:MULTISPECIES: ATP-grasp domain-containing protein [unclassified Caballeronia]MDR5775597.1 ATP-grasp domain-containing protein [Caballeronia sp. LZ002]MDR5802308.1 ATP-grasp domain-containing protein [Caballeronia sp. LZ001]MDR5851035.1 ATP-grasp domain-containing protein [Caballeronia sp. LZ003]
MKVAIIVGSGTPEASDIMSSARLIETTLCQLDHSTTIIHWHPTLSDAPQCLAELCSCQAAFPLISGIEGLLEAIGIPYIGSDSTAAGIAANKGILNDLLVVWGFGKTRYARLLGSESFSAQSIEHLKYPLFVKPARLGASLGIEKVEDSTEILSVIARVREFDSELVIEEAVVGHEAEVAVIAGATEVIASQPGIVKLPPEVRWHTYAAKDLSRIIVPSDLSAEVCEQLQALARELTRRLGASGALRLDFFVTADNTILVGEINCLPGQGRESNFPRLFEESGINRQEQMHRLLCSAFESANYGNRNKTKF